MLHLLASLVLATAFASTFELNGTLEREPFPVITGATSIEDSTEDVVTFDAKMQNKLPPVVADLTAASITAGANAWTVHFDTKNDIPEDPGMPVNFNIYFDVDGVQTNNAQNGVFRTDSDLIAMLLFGTRTKWHTNVWKYNASSGQWDEQTVTPAFRVTARFFTLEIPYSLVPRDAPFTAKFQALTSDNAGIVSVDMAPGIGLPAVRGDEVIAPTVQQPQAIVPTGWSTQQKWTLGIFVVLLLGSLYAWKASSR